MLPEQNDAPGAGRDVHRQWIGEHDRDSDVVLARAVSLSQRSPGRVLVSNTSRPLSLPVKKMLKLSVITSSPIEML